MATKLVRLYLCPVPSSVALNVSDADADEPMIYFENIKECLTDASCDKLTYFAELKQEQALFMKKLYKHMVLKNDGAYNKHHVLFDLMVMYKTYVQLADESAFGSNVLHYCEQFITGAFEVFGLGSRIVVLVPPGWENDNLSVLLKHLHGLNLIAIDFVQ
ncbi:P18 protein [Spilosoma obliqua nucleopolyhedrosis virus]|uniref:P18 n=2 Tax=Alphabaculovirus TaxID=558016 RepID=Q2NNX2_NPVHC|nr:P18 [Hyphantria cunea nucleopolyhedrovirus]AUR45088.1 P18 protein [Spilosoma obliqua nucleopolyhedrosis virus]QNN89359.1 P18 protein [Spilarctia obliqua nucleopolyhedrovirus]BAE72350.1 P18 [Hyphantria cunea nucleopolyhedrovirus]